jgi:hypothetical protein
MRTVLRGAACAAATTAVVIAGAAGADAAQPDQLCRTDGYGNTILYTSPSSGIWVPPGSLVRILDYRGPSHYLARYSGTVGQLERGHVVQSTCYDQ